MNTLRYLGYLLLFLPWLVQAGESADFTTASRSQQALLLENWASAPQPQRLALLEALRNETVVIDENKQPFLTAEGAARPSRYRTAARGRGEKNDDEQSPAGSDCQCPGSASVGQ